jgi:pyruvate, orthophosphate dikinase
VSLQVVAIPEAARLGLGADLLGGKGAGLAAMCRLGLPVPAGFVVTTEVGRSYLRDGRVPTDVKRAIGDAVGRLEQEAGRRLGDPRNPLIVSVRSGAEVSMPGMMSTVLDVGAPDSGPGGHDPTSARFALDTRRRFLRSYATTVLGLDEQPFAALEARGKPASPTCMAELVREFESVVAAAGRAIPADPFEQLEHAVEAVLSSWESPRARTYRALHGVPDDLGTAVTVQRMVFGNRDDRSATGVAFSRDPTTGAPEPYGDVLFTAQGADVVAGRQKTERLASLADRMPGVWAQLIDAMATLEGHLHDMCNVEFTVDAGELWLLQTRRGSRTDRAAIRIAVDLADEGSITRQDAVGRIDPPQVRAGNPTQDEIIDGHALTTGLGASPGVATGRIATTAREAVQLAEQGAVILVRPVTSPIDIHGIAASNGVLTSSGGLASHAAVVARSLAKPAVVGASDVHVDAAAGTITIGQTVLSAGDVLTIDGSSGAVVAGDVQTKSFQPDQHVERLLAWADDIAGAPPVGRPAHERLAAAHAVWTATY